ncbi:MAG: efflux RND transporter periplasmic adaptor subunit [Thermodesulfobacteriota bacterium]
MKKKTIAVICCVVLLGGGVALIKQRMSDKKNAPRPAAQAKQVHTSTAFRGDLRITRTCTGVVEGWQNAKIAARINAAVEKILVAEGDTLKQGEVLLILEDDAEQAALAGARARLQQSRAELKALEAEHTANHLNLEYWEREAARDQNLVQAGAIPQAQADTSTDQRNNAQGRLESSRERVRASQAAMETMKKEVALAQTRLEYTRLRAPFDATVTNVAVDPGDMAQPGTLLAEVEDQTRRKLVFNLPQEQTRHLKAGQEVRLHAEPDAELQVKRIYPRADPVTHQVEVEAWGTLPASMSSGAYAVADVILRHLEDVVLVPAHSLIPMRAAKNGSEAEDSNRRFRIFTLEDGVLNAREVHSPARNATHAAVEGVEPGTVVATHSLLGWNTLKAGDRVEVQQ